jgi:hypothetical protein
VLPISPKLFVAAVFLIAYGHPEKTGTGGAFRAVRAHRPALHPGRRGGQHPVVLVDLGLVPGCEPPGRPLPGLT